MLVVESSFSGMPSTSVLFYSRFSSLSRISNLFLSSKEVPNSQRRLFSYLLPSPFFPNFFLLCGQNLCSPSCFIQWRRNIITLSMKSKFSQKNEIKTGESISSTGNVNFSLCTTMPIEFRSQFSTLFLYLSTALATFFHTSIRFFNTPKTFPNYHPYLATSTFSSNSSLTKMHISSRSMQMKWSPNFLVYVYFSPSLSLKLRTNISQ